MNCSEFQQQTRDWIRGGGLPEDGEKHAAICPACSQWLVRERELTMALADLAGEARHMAASAEVESRVLAAFQVHRPQPFRLARFAIAAAVLIAVVIAGYRIRNAGGPPPAAAVSEAGPFYSISPGAAIETGGFAPVVRMRLPRRDLQRIGLAAWGSAESAGASLEVDILVGRDGVAKAVRLVRNADN